MPYPQLHRKLLPLRLLRHRLRDLSSSSGVRILSNYLSVKVTHRLNGYPQNGEEFIDPKFVSHFIERNPATFASLQEADIVVVNGEGTLHHLSQGSISLLYMIFLASRILNKPTYLVNHSCFPGGDMQHSDIDLLYQTALSGLIDTVIREPLSASFYERAQLTFRQGFDSLHCLSAEWGCSICAIRESRRIGSFFPAEFHFKHDRFLSSARSCRPIRKNSPSPS